MPYPAEPRALSPPSRALVHKLAAVELFALGGVGYGGSTSAGEKLTLELSRQPDAIEAFTWLGQLPAPASRLYAYWALRTLDPDRAAALAARLQQDNRELRSMQGCIMFHTAVSKLLATVERDTPMPRP